MGKKRERMRERLIYRSNNRPNVSTTDNATTTDNARLLRARMPGAGISARAELRESARRFVLTTVNARNGERDVTLDDR